jgi:acetyltransferase-like isoleucine patch superfamily enzyme
MTHLFYVIYHRASYLLSKNILGIFWKLEMSFKGVTFLNIKQVDVIGRPIISIAFRSKILIGKDVTLMNSSRFCLSSSLFAPCKISTITGNAVIRIANSVSLNGTSIVCRSTKISIGERTMIGPNVAILDSPFHALFPLEFRNNYPGNELDRPVFIGDDVWVGMQVIILPGAHIGNGSVIGAGSIVTGFIPEKVLAIGSPAKVIKTLEQK